MPRSRNLRILPTFQRNSHKYSHSLISGPFQAKKSHDEDCLESGFLSCLETARSDIKISPSPLLGSKGNLASANNGFSNWSLSRERRGEARLVVVVVRMVRMRPIKILPSLLGRITLVNTNNPYIARPASQPAKASHWSRSVVLTGARRPNN